MRARASKDGITLRIIAGSNNVILAMDLTEEARRDCLGFTIERTDVETGDRRWLPNMLRFESDAAKDQLPKRQPRTKPRKPEMAPPVTTARAPLQRFRWGDYSVEPGRRYCYRVIARKETAKEIIATGKNVEHRHAFDLIPGGVAIEIKTENNREEDASVFFNRGAAASDAYNQRYGKIDPEKIPDALWWLSRGLEEAITTFIGRATGPEFGLHAAIYEFQKGELLRSLKEAKRDREVEVKVVYHARVKKGKTGRPNSHDMTARKNKEAILKARIEDLVVPRRADPQGAIMHNKFIVLLQKDADQYRPVAVWTGSTNWTRGAIYGQLNVGHAVFNDKLARTYETYFQLLAQDLSASAMKRELAKLTPVPKSRANIQSGITPIFSPQKEIDMIKLYAEICKKAKVLMVCAPFALHKAIRDTFADDRPEVMRFLMGDKEGAFGNKKKGEITLLRRDWRNAITVATVLKTPLNDFQGNLLQDAESFHHAGVHVHSKVIIADPFGVDPILITGSANFSKNSAQVNDSNSLIIRGDTAVADIYVTEFMRMFEHYWFRAHIEGKTSRGKKKKTKAARLRGLLEDPSWSDSYYKKNSREMTERLTFAAI